MVGNDVSPLPTPFAVCLGFREEQTKAVGAPHDVCVISRKVRVYTQVRMDEEDVSVDLVELDVSTGSRISIQGMRK